MLRSMIRIMLLTILLVVNINSQSITNYGLKLGAVASNPIWKIGDVTYDGVETKMGMDFGFFLNWSINNNLSVLTEVHYVQKGFRFYEPVVKSQSSGVVTYVKSINPKVNYLSLPVLAKYNLLTSEVTPYIICGLRVDVMLSKNEIDNLSWTNSNVKDIDFGGSIGLGFQTKSLIGIGTGIEFKYSPSFIKVNTSPFAEITNRSFEVSFIVYN